MIGKLKLIILEASSDKYFCRKIDRKCRGDIYPPPCKIGLSCTKTQKFETIFNICISETDPVTLIYIYLYVRMADLDYYCYMAEFLFHA